MAEGTRDAQPIKEKEPEHSKAECKHLVHGTGVHSSHVSTMAETRFEWEAQRSRSGTIILYTKTLKD